MKMEWEILIPLISKWESSTRLWVAVLIVVKESMKLGNVTWMLRYLQTKYNSRRVLKTLQNRQRFALPHFIRSLKQVKYKTINQTSNGSMLKMYTLMPTATSRIRLQPIMMLGKRLIIMLLRARLILAKRWLRMGTLPLILRRKIAWREKVKVGVRDLCSGW